MGETIYQLEEGYAIKVITDLEGFYQLQPEWDRLLESHKSHVPFLCFDWFRIWLKHFLREDGLFIVLLYEQNLLVAIAPMVFARESIKGILKVRKVSLIGNVYSPVRNVLFNDLNKEARQKYWSKILLFFTEHFIQWDVMELDSLPVEDDTFDILNNVVARLNLKSRQYFCFADWYLDGIDFSGEEYINRLPKKTRNEIKRREKRLKEIGTLEVVRGINKISFDQQMNLYYQVRRKSWKSPESDQDFHCEVREMFDQEGWLRCGTLFLNDIPIAAQIRVVHDGTVYFMEALHDSDYGKYGPGTILRAEFTKYFIDVEQISEIDQIRGDESYKKYWTPNRRERRGITIFNNNAQGQLMAFLMITILPVIKKHPLLMAIKKRLLH